MKLHSATTTVQTNQQTTRVERYYICTLKFKKKQIIKTYTHYEPTVPTTFIFQ